MEALMTRSATAYIRGQVDGIVAFLRMTHPSLTREEIYDAIDEVVDFVRARATWSNPQAQQQQESAKHSGLSSLGQQGEQESAQYPGPLNKGGER